MDSPVLWYLNRSTGLVLLVLLTATVVLGVISAGSRRGPDSRAVPRFVSQSLHRNVALLSVLFLTAHVVSAVIDSYVDIRWWQAFFPVGATYQPLWLGMGAFALDLIAAVTLTSLLRTRLRVRTWRTIHLLAYAAWVVAVIHGVGIGTDMTLKDPWGVLVTGTCVGMVALAVAWRLSLVIVGHNTRARSAT